MKVSRIEIFGFKSFLEKLVLPLDQGITAVVGPNGCGKSNLVDALRWVFGETRASQLRGSLLEDVIFNGTENLRPLGLAEVSLVISTEKASLKEDILETRFKSKYALEEVEISLPDISIKDQPIEVSPAAEAESKNAEQQNGRPHLVVIDGALSNKSAKTENSDKKETAVAEEAQQVQPAQSSMQAKNNRQADQDSSLEKFAWLKLSKEVEITRRLYRSGESEFFINKVPCRLRDLKELFRLLGLGARSYTLVAQGEVSRIITSKPEERRLMIEEAAGVSGVREKLAAAQRRLEETKINVSRLNDLIAEVTRQVNSLRVQASRAKSRAELKSSLQELDYKITADKLIINSEKSLELTTSLNELAEREFEASEKLQQANLEEETVQKELIEFQHRREEISRQVRQLRTELTAKREQRQALASELQSLEQKFNNESQRNSELQIRAKDLEQQIVSSKQEIENSSSSIETLEQKIRSLDKVRTEDLQFAVAELEKARTSHSQANNAYQNKKSELLAVQARLEALTDQLESLNPLKLTAKNENLKQLASGLSPLLEHVAVEDQYKKSLEAVLIVLSNIQLTDDIQNLMQALRQSPELAQGCNQVRVYSAAYRSNQIPLEITSLRSFSSLIRVSGSHAEAIINLFSQFYLAENIDQAESALQQLSDQQAQHCIIVTLAGELLSKDSIGFGKEIHGTVELYSRKRELQTQNELLEANVKELQEKQQESKSILDSAQAAHSEALSKSVEADKEIRQLTSDIGAQKGKFEVVNKMIQRFTEELRTIQQANTEWQQREHQLSSRIEQIQMVLDAPQDETENSEELLNELEERLDLADSESKQLISSLEIRSKNKEAIRIEFEALSNKKNKASFELEKIQIDMATVKDRFHELYPEQDIEALKGLGTLDPQQRAGAAHEAERLRTRIVREGEVDPSSIEMFEQEEARLADLKHQRKDLEEAADILAATVIELNDLARKRFLETFKIVQANFTNLVPKVFGGGHGSLILENKDDPFSGGIDVNVRPPGKKPKSIELLSGGERALCAIALIFSMFLHRPSPLCVLDEVDAPLDEANLRRYLEMVQEMSKTTQFMMITHNKEAMSAADRLVGVTQEVPGASRVVTVSLEQAQAVAG